MHGVTNFIHALSGLFGSVPEWAPHDHSRLHSNVQIGSGVETALGLRDAQMSFGPWSGGYGVRRHRRWQASPWSIPWAPSVASPWCAGWNVGIGPGDARFAALGMPAWGYQDQDPYGY